MISVYYYLNVVKSMYLGTASDERPFALSVPVQFTVWFAMAATLFLGVYPGPMSKLADLAVKSIFH